MQSANYDDRHIPRAFGLRKVLKNGPSWATFNVYFCRFGAPVRSVQIVAMGAPINGFLQCTL